MRDVVWERLEAQVKKSLVQTAAYVRSNDGIVLYTVVAEGESATFFGAELETGHPVVEVDVPGATGSWTVVEAGDGMIYFGTYVNAGLYRYDPNSGVVEDLGCPVPGAKFIYGLVADDSGYLYGGTWPNCAIFKYDCRKSRTESFFEHVAGEEHYVRYLCGSGKPDVLYAGIMSHAQILEFDYSIGTGANLLPRSYSDQSHISVVGIKENRLVAVSALEKRVLVLDLATRKIVFDSPVVPPRADVVAIVKSQTVFFGLQNLLVGVNVQTGGIYVKAFPGGAIVRDPVEIGNGLVAGLCFDGVAFSFDIAKSDVQKYPVEFPKKPIEFRQLHVTENDTLYASGYLRGGTIEYDLSTARWNQLEGIGQCEGITSHRGKVYFGKYPGSYVYEYDPTRPWDMSGDADANPRLLFNLKERHRQDRPFAMSGHEGKLYIGTIPDYGQTQGTLTTYDIEAGSVEVRADISPDRSVVSFAPLGSVLYGGTTPCGGLGTTCVHESGTLFGLDLETGKILFDRIVVPGARNIGGLLALSEIRIAGCADSTFFLYDPLSDTVTFKETITPHDPDVDYRWEISFLRMSPNGEIYGITGGRLFVFDPVTEKIEHIGEDEVNLLDVDSAGRVYTVLDHDIRSIVRSR